MHLRLLAHSTPLLQLATPHPHIPPSGAPLPPTHALSGPPVPWLSFLPGDWYSSAQRQGSGCTQVKGAISSPAWRESGEGAPEAQHCFPGICLLYLWEELVQVLLGVSKRILGEPGK